ncbi:2-oxo acid dehydrogenase subunit E2 [Tersicoccus sp. MR15.9]|uniref:dihydrolipoamide acetyltransferase family protein n=1 Tax=Tersicoccus mangrovi TaxID=3121635 RepID=UPI002FE67D62
MIREFALPDLGEGLTESEIVSWKVTEGQSITLNQVIAEVETAKAVVQLPSPWDGVVQRLLQAEGTTVDVGTPILAIDVPAADGSGDGAGTGEVGAARREPTLVGYGAAPAGSGRPTRRRRAVAVAGSTGSADDQPEPQPGDEPGQPGVPDAPRVPRDPDQPDPEQPQPDQPQPDHSRPEEPGVPLPGHTPGEPALPTGPDEPLRPGGPEVPPLPGRPDEPLSPNGPEIPPLPGAPDLPRPDQDGASARRGGSGAAVDGRRDGQLLERRLSTPIVRKLARDLGVDLESLTGTGRGGLVTRDDVTAAAAAPTVSVLAAPTPVNAPAATSTSASAAAAATTPVAPAAGGPARETREPIRGVRKHTAAAMVASAFTAPHVTEFLTVDVTESVALLESLRADRAWREDRPTMTALVAKAVLVALRRHPELNSRWDEAAGEIVRFGYVNLGIAAATPRGLVVPTIKDADALDLRALTGALRDLTAAAREGRTTPAALSGGTFTISNVGVFGVDAGTPILNPGEAGILATGQVRRTPWEHNGQIALRDVMTLSLSFDHRLVDGEAGSRFLADVGAVLRAPGATLTLV